MNQARLERRDVARNKRLSHLHPDNLPLVDAWRREDDVPFRGLPLPQEQANTGGFQRLQQVRLALGDPRDRRDPFPQAGRGHGGKGYGAALLGERRPLEGNDGILVDMTDEHDVVAIDGCPSLQHFPGPKFFQPECGPAGITSSLTSRHVSYPITTNTPVVKGDNEGIYRMVPPRTGR